MPIELRCPKCGSTVQLLRDGYVTEHPDQDGARCSFVRTASSPGHQKVADRTPEEQADYAARLKKLRERDRKGSKVTGEGSKKPSGQKSPRPECPRCGKRVDVSKKSLTGLAAHRRPSGHWCKGGADPTPAQRERGYARRSVRTVSGGLPTLGKH